MNEIVAELFGRFVASLPTGEDAALRAEDVQGAGSAAASQPPCHTVVIYGRHGGDDGPLAVVLMTSPAAAVDDPKILNFVVRRARAHKAPYFVTWTLRDAILWRTPKPGTPAARDALDALRDYPDIFEISTADQDSLTEPSKIKVVQRGKEILGDLERLLKDEALELVKIDATYFVGRLIEAVHRLLPMVSRSLQLRLETDHPLRQEIAVWGVRQGIAGDPRDAKFCESIARQIVYRLLGKILFYQSLRRSARHLPDLNLRGLDTAQILPTLRRAFAQALEIDYYAVFAEDLPDRIQWPGDASGELAQLIDDFHTRDFSHVPQDVIGAVFEQLIPPEERHGFGQYFTPENLCDLIIGFCIQSVDDRVLDPTCGTGTFLIRAYDRIRWLGRVDHEALLSQLWGVDIAPFPAELATINLFRQRVADHGSFPRIICADLFELAPGQCFQFPPPKMDLDRPETVEHEIPAFDAIVGNFPFIRQEKIEKLVPGYKRQIERVIAEAWFDSYPEAFTFRSKRLRQEFEKFRRLNQPCHELMEHAELKLSGKADILAYLFFHTARFLRPGGRMGIITSNAWLDVDYGHELQEFLLDNFKIIAILESRCEPWFTEADVNTIATIVERCESPRERSDHLVKFVKVKQPLATLIPPDPRTAAVDRWTVVRNLTGQMERAGRKDRKTRPLGALTVEDDKFRMRVCRQGELLEQIESRERTAKWGIFLRAPDLYFSIQDLSKVPFVPLGTVADVVNGFVTRINDFFYLSEEVITRFEIEPEFVKPVLRSPREFRGLCISPGDLKSSVFLCTSSKDELRKHGKSGASRYIEWGETQKTADGTPWPDGPSVRHRKPGWWALGLVDPAQLFWAEHLGEVLAHRFSDEPIYADHNLHLVRVKEQCDAELIAALLNSSLGLLCQEVVGRQSLGGGAVKLIAADIEADVLLPSPSAIPPEAARTIKTTFRRLSTRNIYPVFEEVKQRDRRDFDTAVLEGIGLNPRKFLSDVTESLCQLVRERLDLAKTRGKERKTRSRTVRAEKRVEEDVLNEILPDGPRQFPEDFLSLAAGKCSKTAIDLPDEPLVFENTPMFMGVHVQGGSYDRHVKSPAEGKFLVYAQQAGQKTAELPDKPVEVSRTVANYEKYLRELRAQLYEAYYRRTLDAKAAARLTQAAFDRFRLPNLESQS